MNGACYDQHIIKRQNQEQVNQGENQDQRWYGGNGGEKVEMYWLHSQTRQDKRWTLRILQWTPRDNKRTRSRPQRRWVDIKEIAGENRTEIDECGTVWRRLSFRSG